MPIQFILIVAIIGSLLAIGIGFAVGYFSRKKVAESKLTSAENEVDKILENAKSEARAIIREKSLEAKEEAHRLRNEVEKESRERRSELNRLERRLVQKEETLDKKNNAIEKKEEDLQRKKEHAQKVQKKIDDLYKQQLAELERLSMLSQNEAKELLLEKVGKEIKHEMAIMIKDIEDRAHQEAKKKSREIVTIAIQRCAAEHTSETTVSVVNLPNDDMKGRIIGREGRNIRALENLTGIDLIIDDTPGAVIISGFDPIRREIARISLEKLINDGRIHPARIEEMVEKSRQEIESTIKEEGERAVLKTGVHGLHAELVNHLGKLRYRTSYGQNVLQHSIEVSKLAGIMAAELGLDINLAK
ncbi:MAG: ribonuclease Y, partial [Firmicutes bacterium]|nr:ribonuclease Y [Bacillota bacterium]